MFRSRFSIRILVVLSILVAVSSTCWARGPTAAGGRGGPGLGGPGRGGTGRGGTAGGPSSTVHRGPVAGPRAGGHHAFAPGHPPHAAHHGPHWGHPHYGLGYPYYGYPYYGYGVGIGVGYGYPVYAPYGGAAYYSSTTVVAPVPVVTASGTVPPRPSMADSSLPDRARDFDDRGKNAFRVGNYADAAYAWRHAVVDAPENPALVMQLALALFALGKYEESAGATQAAMRQTPKEHWGDTIGRYRELYGDPVEYTRQLRTLEAAIAKTPANPALRFLAGYHFGYLGFRKQSVEQLDKLIAIEPRDELAKSLRDVFQQIPAAKDSVPSLPPVPAFDQPERATQ